MSGNPDDFSFSGGLPYDEDETRSAAAPSKPFNPDLDFALDDRVNPPRRGGAGRGEYEEREYRQQDRRERREPQERTANLYLLSEIKPVVRQHKMASDLLEEDYSVDEVDVPAYPVPDDPSVRTNALYFQGTPVTELPTGKIFTYISSFSTSVPLGIEWIADDRLVAVFPSQKAASIALASLLIDPEPSSASTTGQLVPLSLWPKEYKKVKAAPSTGELRMEVDDGEGAAGDASEVMQGAIEVRWARVEDKKGYSKGSASNFYRKNGHQAGKPQAFDDHPSSSSRPGRATHTSTWAHDLHDDISSSSSSFNAHGLPSRPSYSRDPEVPYQDLGVDLLAPSFSLERPSHYRGDDNDEEDDRSRRGTTIRGRSRRSASPPNLSAPGENSTRRAASLLKRFAGRSRSRSPPSSKLSERIAKIPLDERMGIKLSASGDLLGEEDLPSGGGMRIDGRAPANEVDLMDAIGGGKGAGMMIDREYVQQGAVPRRQGNASSFGRSGERGVYEREGGGGGGRESFGSRQQEDRGGRRDDRDRRGGEGRRDDRSGGGRDQRGGGGGRRGEARAEDLDSELEEFLKKR